MSREQQQKKKIQENAKQWFNKQSPENEKKRKRATIL